jgi:hypothetical protein
MPPYELTEKEWDQQLFDRKTGLATMLGWNTWHVLRPKGSPAGLPDRLCWRDRIIYVELKREKGKLSDAQVRVLTALARAGGETYVWFPADLEAARDVLQARSFQHDNPSRWLAAGCRMDQLTEAAA